MAASPFDFNAPFRLKNELLPCRCVSLSEAYFEVRRRSSPLCTISSEACIRFQNDCICCCWFVCITVAIITILYFFRCKDSNFFVILQIFEQRMQKNACIYFAESRENSTYGQAFPDFSYFPSGSSPLILSVFIDGIDIG